MARIGFCVLALAWMSASAMPIGVRTMMHVRAAARQTEKPVPVCYTVAYAPGENGTGVPQTAMKTNGVAMALKGAIFIRDGCAQTGWATSDGGAKAYDLGATYAADESITLYPFWTANSYRLAIKSNKSKYGTVNDGGTYAYGSKATLKATTKKNCVFAGWFTDKACTKPLNPKGYDNRKPTVKYAMPAKNITIYAKFVTKAAEKSALKFSSAAKKLAKTPAKAAAGSAFSLKLGVSSVSLPVFTAKGLPKGLSIDRSTGEITGVGTVPGVSTAKVTVTAAGGSEITQDVKITVEVPSWATGVFYGTARPGAKSADSMAYLQFTAGSTGKVSGKVIYNGNAYSFTSDYKRCTAAKATFAPKVKIGKSYFKPGTVTVKARKTEGVSVVEAANATASFALQKKANLIKKGKPLAKLVGKTFKFAKGTKGSGLTKSGDKLVAKLGDGDTVAVSGIVKGRKLTVSWVALLSDIETADGVATYRLYVDIIGVKQKYEKTLVITAKVGPGGGVTATAGFAELHD